MTKLDCAMCLCLCYLSVLLSALLTCSRSIYSELPYVNSCHMWLVAYPAGLMGIMYTMVFTFPTTRVCLSAYPAQATASRLSTCRLAAGHTPVLHGRHTPITTLPTSNNFTRHSRIFCTRGVLEIWRQSLQLFPSYKRTNIHSYRQTDTHTELLY